MKTIVSSSTGTVLLYVLLFLSCLRGYLLPFKVGGEIMNVHDCCSC